MSLSDHVDWRVYELLTIAPCFETTCRIKAGGFLFGKIAPMVERWIEAPRGIGSSPILPTI